jgi:hypothetical protein
MNRARRDLSVSPAASRSSSARSDSSARSSPALTSAVTHSLQQSTGLEQRDPPLIETFHTSVRRTTSEPGDNQFSIRHDEQYVPRPTKLLKAFNAAYVPFRDGKPIPMEARQKLEEFKLSSEEFYGLVTARELPKSRYIYLDQGKIKFDEWTQPPHAQVIIEVAVQVALQDRPFRLFDGGTGEGNSCLFVFWLIMCRCSFASRTRQTTGRTLDRQC